MSHRRFVLVILMLSAALAGCASNYAVPGGAAPLRVMGASAGEQAVHGDPVLRKYYDARPLAQFPAVVAVARVQSSGYESRTASGVGAGNYSVITTRDVEGDEAIRRLNTLPQVMAVAPISRLLLPKQLRDEDQLREAAARVKADVLILYTFDSKFYVKDFAKPVTVVTLGLSPNRRAYVDTTASAVILDVRSGFVYGGAEATARSDQAANGWTSGDAVDDARLRTERESFEKLVGQIEAAWATVLAQHARKSGEALRPTTVPL